MSTISGLRRLRYSMHLHHKDSDVHQSPGPIAALVQLWVKVPNGAEKLQSCRFI
jgi:hypothetical protein